MVEKYGFVYIWYDRKHKRYYVGSHWGHEDDGYICSSKWMLQAYKKRSQDFRRRILKRIYTNRADLLNEELRYLNMMKEDELRHRYYNIVIKTAHWGLDPNRAKTIRERISQKTKEVMSRPAVREKYENGLKTRDNTGPRDPSVGAAISAAKKGKPLAESHKEALRGIKKPAHTDEWKSENAERMRRQWSDGTRKRAVPRKTMTQEEQSALSSERLKSKWADQIWAENQRARLRAGAAKRRMKNK